MSNASAAPDIGIAGAENLVYLVSCAVHGTTPDAARIDGMDLGAVYSLAERHMLSAAAAMALASAGREDRSFAQARGKAVAKAAQLEIEKDLLLEQMESAGIWYMPLKGAVLQKLYPAVGMRQMSDVDILFDAARAKDVREILERQGFSCKHFGAGAHDVYHKEPVCSFEMHRTLFEKKKSQRRMYEYYADVRKRLKKDQGNRCGYHFSSEDLYVFLTAHEFKHYNGGGTGLRSLLDVYVFLSREGDGLDREYIHRELHALGLVDFEARSRRLAMDLFGGEGFSTAEKDMLTDFHTAGTYGTFQRGVDRGIATRGRARYIWYKLFLPYREMVFSYPFLLKAPVLLPFCWVHRLGTGLLHKRNRIRAILRSLNRSVKEK